MATSTRDKSKEDFWRKFILDQQSSDLTIAAWCRKHKRSKNLFHWWKRQLAKRDRERFAVVEVTNSLKIEPAHATNFTLNLQGIGLLHIPNGFDSAELRRLLDALKTPAC